MRAAASVYKSRKNPKYMEYTSRKPIDQTLFLVVLILVFFGIMMVFSASYIQTGRSATFGFNPFFFLQRHSIMATLGAIGMIIMMNFNYRYLEKLATPLYLASLGLLLFTAVYGALTNGSRRWIQLFDVQFQPSEIAKVALILMLARLLSKNRRILDRWPGFLFTVSLVGIMSIFVAVGNLSTAIIIAVIGFGMIFMASPHTARFVVFAVVSVAGMLSYLYFMAFLAPPHIGGQFRGGRFLAWIDPFSDSSYFGFQIINSLYAIASGGLFGLGIGQSRQKEILPEAHHDIIFSIIVEELGLLGAGIILILFSILIWRGIRIALATKNDFGSLIAIGVILMIASQVIINVAVVTNTIPNTGIPMPFISYGGTALVTVMGAVGILLNVSRYADI
ncbi:MAG: FtsW/RodA/SpoVE family cell cycle protein [Turicibacter sp.]|nr:FtsW/RodA/SpoVE family cell cycle protein [Turicibacter sp.]